MRLSKRIEVIEGSKTARFIPLVEKLRQEGRSVISLAIGEPPVDTPEPVIAATIDALNGQKTRYSDMAGLPQLRAALAREFPGCGPENIGIFNGSKQALYAAFQAICDPGDEVIVPVPCWVSFSEQIKLAGGRPVFVPTADHQLDLDAIQRAINTKTRAILVNSPNNPTGAVYPRQDLEKIARMAQKHDLFLVADEAYHFFVYDELSYTSLYALADVRDRLIVTRSFSKHYAMTGFRVGYTVAPAAVTAAMVRLHGHVTGNVCTFAQHGALAALDMDTDLLIRRRADLQRKRDLAFDQVSAMFPCIRPQGAFYLFPDISDHLHRGETSGGFAARILEKTGVAVVPGEDFGLDGHVRICFAAPEEQLMEAFNRLRGVL
ncbi:pyridoxal phosphate-dependent aminotransferase [Desulfosarcina sp.]|uniref:pyridoxal phosphate-dependent aminotransferase n=1 Tax=Desulfosarcina sp. TaxID=2027861 RepID=UPI003562EF23